MVLVTEPWFDMYLESRDPLVLNYNPFMAFKDDPQGITDQVSYVRGLTIIP